MDSRKGLTITALGAGFILGGGMIQNNVALGEAPQGEASIVHFQTDENTSVQDSDSLCPADTLPLPSCGVPVASS